MDEGDNDFKIFIVGIIVIVIVIIISFIVLENVSEKLERTCALYDMEYYYDVGSNCIEEDGKRHSIAVMNCPLPIKRGTCEIKFIK